TSRPYHPRSPKSGSVGPGTVSQDMPTPAPSPSSPPEGRGLPPASSGTLEPSSSPCPPAPKTTNPSPLFTEAKEPGSSGGTDVNRPSDSSPARPLEFKATVKGLPQSPSDHKRNQIEELKKFGEDFRVRNRFSFFIPPHLRILRVSAHGERPSNVGPVLSCWNFPHFWDSSPSQYRVTEHRNRPFKPNSSVLTQIS
ncbi:hypothetical protein chiPu_0025283, partial [Chiloscyllium punctatum]|nr:hypothetical protein [Chiloscyllium punctatum]